MEIRPVTHASAVMNHNHAIVAADVLDVRQGYALWASCYDVDGNPLIAIEEPAMRAWYGPLEGKRALDLGCGTGRHSRALAERGAKVVGVDMTPEMLAKARENPPEGFAGVLRQVLPGPLPFRDATFDLVVMGLVAEHLADLERTLREVNRVLIDQGRCLISALHPERTASGMTARFIDAKTGERRPIATIHREEVAYLSAADEAGLKLMGCRTLTVPPELVARLPRAAPYVDLPLGWIGAWYKSASRRLCVPRDDVSPRRTAVWGRAMNKPMEKLGIQLVI